MEEKSMDKKLESLFKEAKDILKENSNVVLSFNRKKPHKLMKKINNFFGQQYNISILQNPPPYHIHIYK